MATPFDINRARQETPGCGNVLHFNNAGSSLPPQLVVNAVISHLRRESAMGGYEAAEEAQEKVEDTYASLAGLIHAKSAEIAVVESATRAWDMVFYAIPFKHGDIILTARSEYASNYIAFLQVAKKTGAIIKVIPDDEHGQLSLDALRTLIDERVKLIAITHVPTNAGLVNPVEAVGKIAGEAGILFLLDACQSVGQMPIDVERIGCHLLSATGRKYLRAPRGSGFLYVNKNWIEKLEPPFLDLHAAARTSIDNYTIRPDARRFESWEASIAIKIGLGVAARYAQLWGLSTIWARVQILGERLRQQLSAILGVHIQDKGEVRCGIVTFTCDRLSADDIRLQLQRQAINISVSSMVDARVNIEPRALLEVARASVHYYNTEEEIDRFCQAIAALKPQG